MKVRVNSTITIIDIDDMIKDEFLDYIILEDDRFINTVENIPALLQKDGKIKYIFKDGVKLNYVSKSNKEENERFSF